MVPTATRALAEPALPSGRRHIGQPLGRTASGVERRATKSTKWATNVRGMGLKQRAASTGTGYSAKKARTAKVTGEELHCEHRAGVATVSAWTTIEPSETGMKAKSTGWQEWDVSLANAIKRNYGGARGGWSCDLSLVDIDPEATLMLTRDFCMEHLVLTIAVSEQSIVVVMADVDDAATVDAIHKATGREVLYGMVAETALRRAIDTHLPATAT